MSKGQIYKELVNVSRFTQNSIKSYNELSLEGREISDFENKTPRRIHRTKNHSIWISIHKESSS